VLLLLLDNEKRDYERVGILTSNSVAGPYQIQRFIKPGKLESRDFSAYVYDGDGIIAYDSDDDKSILTISKLSRSFTRVDDPISTLDGDY
jgi:hypothetical protein